MELEESVSLLEVLKEKFFKILPTKSSYQHKAWNRFVDVGLPQKDQEAFRYVSLQKLYDSSFSLLEQAVKLTKEKLPQTDSKIRFVFVNGLFDEALSTLEGLDSEVVYSTLEEASVDYPSLIKSKEEKFFKDPHKTGFDYLNAAFYEKGFFIYIPPKVVIKEKIEFLEVITQGKIMTFPRSVIYIGKGSEVSFVHKTLEQEGSSWVNASMELHLEAGSSCAFESHMLGLSSSLYFSNFTAFLKKDAKLYCYGIDQGASCLRTEYKVELLEENAEIFLKGLSLLQDHRQTHVWIKVEHKAPHTRSHQHFKTLFFEQSKGSFEGKIWVDRVAQKTEAYQLCNQLLLSDQARAYAKPNLEIFADDVKASHGATIANLDEEELFYLKARGLEQSMAKMLLIRGFCQEIGSFFDKGVQKQLYKYIEEILNKDK